ncbi:helix-turn-helix domain-containing protein [Deinococcus puniceus]|nr:helix-turn-helix domain-containing protein [Deinococcus puniceus]
MPLQSVYDLIRSGELRSICVGRRILIPLTAIEDFLNDGAK